MKKADILKINEDIARKFRMLEASLREHRSVAELFEALFANIENEFGIPFVWLSLLRLPETAGLRKALDASTVVKDRVNVIGKERFLEIVPDVSSPLLVGGSLRPFFRLMPLHQKYCIRSLVVSPITVRGLLIGSINHGDSSPSRYEPGMDTTLLRHLAQRVSDRLSVLAP
jgi:uncharacterized protein YigA (DUF484 family)